MKNTRLELTVSEACKLLNALEINKGKDQEMDDLAATIRRGMRFLAKGETVTLVIKRSSDETQETSPLDGGGRPGFDGSDKRTL
jgi:hypothetical protein